MRAESDTALTLQEFKDITRDQALMMTLDSAAAVQAMPRLLDGAPAAAIRETLDTMKHVLEAAEPLSEAARASLGEMERIFEAAEERARKREQALLEASPTVKSAARVASARSAAPAAAVKPAKAVKAVKAVKTAAKAAPPAKRAAKTPARKSAKANTR